VKKNSQTFYNATDSAKYLGVSRQRFYVIKYKYQLEPRPRGYAVADLVKVRRLLDKWNANHGK
jgi:hypothetical protein